jgi:hypothetical protein
VRRNSTKKRRDAGVLEAVARVDQELDVAFPSPIFGSQHSFLNGFSLPNDAVI